MFLENSLSRHFGLVRVSDVLEESMSNDTTQHYILLPHLDDDYKRRLEE